VWNTSDDWVACEFGYIPKSYVEEIKEGETQVENSAPETQVENSIPETQVESSTPETQEQADVKEVQNEK
jgi:hypothetical protein